MNRSRKLLLAFAALNVLLGSLVHSAKADATERRYAALSLIGDTLNVVTYQPQVGSRLNRNKLDRLPMTDGILDRAALKAMDTALSRGDAKADVVLLRARGPELFEGQDRFFVDGTFLTPAGLAEPLTTSGATHLVLLTKHRAEARVVLDGLSYGSGRLEGLGFYLDDGVSTRATQTGEEGLGLVAPFAYFRASLIDLRSRRILGSEFVARTEGVSGALAKRGYGAWEALGETEKMALLGKLIEEQLERVVPELAKRALN